MAGQPPSFTPTGPYGWQESVLSTRSLSYMSTIDGLGLPSPLSRSRMPSIANPQPSSLMDEGSEPDLEMASRQPQREEQEYDSLPPSVSRSRLFTALPREIRDRIYSFCLIAEHGKVIEWPCLPAMTEKKLELSPQLLRTCKIIHAEAAPIAYANNTLVFAHPSDANIFVRSIATPHYSRTISFVNLYVRAQDTRLWMPYLTSSDLSRSLQSDFPSLRQLQVLYRSNKWQHSLPIEANLRHWSDDRHLDEVIDGLRHVFLPPPPKTLNVDGQRVEAMDVFREQVNRNQESLTAAEEAGRQRRLEALQRSKGAFTAQRARAPIVKVVCMCRVIQEDFTALTQSTPAANLPPIHTVGHTPDAPHLTNVLPPLLPQVPVGFGLGPPPMQDQRTALSPPPARLVEEGEDFRGFTAGDFRDRREKMCGYDTVAAVPTVMHVARTVFANKRDILLALEVYMLDSSRT